MCLKMKKGGVSECEAEILGGASEASEVSLAGYARSALLLYTSRRSRVHFQG